MLIPNYDFELFELPDFSALEANEFGATTRFQASDPTSWVDYSLNQLYGLVNPQAAYPYTQRQFPSPIVDVPFVNYFQSPQGRDVTLDEAREVAKRRGCTVFDLITGNCRPAIVTGEAGPKDQDILKSDGGDTLSTPGSKKVGEWLEALPAGSGVFLIAILAIIFLLLFVGRR